MTEGPHPEHRSRVLIMDDDESQLDRLSAILQDEGFAAVGCQTAAAGIERLGRGDIDAAVVELHLTRADEGQLLESLAELAGDVAWIIHTGHRSYESAKRAVNNGAFAYVEKDDDPEELVRQVHRAIQNRLVQRAEVLEMAVAERTRKLQEANEALRSTQADLARAQRIARIGSWEWDLQTGAVSWSDETYRLFGFKPGEVELSYEVVKSTKHPEDVESWANAIEEALDSAGTLQVEYRAVRSDGETIWIRTEAEISRDENGKAIRFFGTAQDITERKRAEEALRESEVRFRSVFAQTYQFAGIVTLDGTLTAANNTSLDFIGSTEADVVGKPFWDTPWWGHSRELREWLRDAISRAAKGEVVRQEVTHISTDGDVHYFDFLSNPSLTRMVSFNT